MDTRIRKQARALRELVDAVLELRGRAFRAEIDRLQRMAVTAAPMARSMEGMLEATYYGANPFEWLEEGADGDESEGCNPPDAIIYRCDTLQ